MTETVQETVACKWCGSQTDATAIAECRSCWEVRVRTEANPEATRRILRHLAADELDRLAADLALANNACQIAVDEYERLTAAIAKADQRLATAEAALRDWPDPLTDDQRGKYTATIQSVLGARRALVALPTVPEEEGT